MGKKRFKKRYIWIGLVVFVLALRIALPYIIVKYVNNLLVDLEGYTGSIEDVDLKLYRGAYQIDSLRIEVIDNDVKEPFVDIPTIDLSVQWKSILRGAIVGEVEVVDPTINFAFGPTSEETQTGETVDWVQIVKDLMPININRFSVLNGDIQLQNISTQPDFSARFSDLDLEITNIRNAESKEDSLPSTVNLRGNSSFAGTIKFDAKADLLKTFPDFNYDARLEGLDLTKFNAISKELVGITIEEGVLDVYSEMTAKNQELNGYVKPLLNDVTVFALKEEDRNFVEAVKEFFVEIGQEALENRKNWEELTATKIPISGTIESTDTGIWSAIINLLVNAYIDRFKGVIDNTIAWKENGGKEEEKTN